jgi:hypothetical protein
MSHAPTPKECLEAPELAILAILRSTLDTAEAILISAHQDLYCPDDDRRDLAFPGSSALSGTLLTLMKALSAQIDLYRRLADGANLPPHWKTSGTF